MTRESQSARRHTLRPMSELSLDDGGPDISAAAHDSAQGMLSISPSTDSAWPRSSRPSSPLRWRA
jgi:hypothetical protein